MQKKYWYHVIRFNFLVILCAVLLLGQGPARALEASKSPDAKGSEAGNNQLSVISWGSGRLDIFYVKGGEGSIWTKSHDNNQWSAWTSLGKPPSNVNFMSVEALTWGPGRLDVFGTTTSYEVWHKTWGTRSGWSAWASLGSGNQLFAIQAVSPVFGQIDLFNNSNAGSSGQPMVRKTWRCCAWSPSQTGWTTLDGASPIAGIGVASSNSNRLTMVRYSISPSTGALQFRNWNGSSWSGWGSLGGQTFYTPALVSWGPGRLDLVVRGTDKAIYHQYSNNDGVTWGDTWEILGQGAQNISYIGGPTMVAWGPNRLDIFNNENGAISHKYWDGSGWGPDGGFESLGSVSANNYSPEVVSWGVGRLDLFMGAGTVYHKWYEGSWGPSQTGAWESLGAP